MPDNYGKYEIIELIGQGQFGSVYKAFDPFLERTVAIKTIDHLNSVNALLREARIAARLNHQNITQIYDADHSHTPPYIVMEYAENSLDDLMQTNGLSYDRTMYICIDITRALSHAHNAGVIHRDIKPMNILIDTSGSAKVADFGLSRATRGESSIGPHTLGWFGTPHYMSPEQWKEDRVDGRSDIYSLGIMIYQMVTGEVPFYGNLLNLQSAHLNDPIPEMPHVPDDIQNIITTATAKNPAERFQNALDMEETIDATLYSLITNSPYPDSSEIPTTDSHSDDYAQEPEQKGNPWTAGENELIVQMYFEMLERQIRDEPFVKSQYYTDFATHTGRSYTAAEFKMRNISFVLDDKGLPWINGLRPAANIQQLLREEVEIYLITRGIPNIK